MEEENIEDLETVDVDSDNSEDQKPSLLSKILKTTGIIFGILFILIIIFSFYQRYVVKSAIESLYGGKENLKEYTETLQVYDSSHAGDYKKCLSLGTKEKQFCLWLAYENTKNIEICNNMDEDFYPPDHTYSKENCIIDIAIANDDVSVCDDVSQKDHCHEIFDRISAKRKVCGSLFTGNYPPTPADCFNYAIEQKSKEVCDNLEAAGGINFKDHCYLEANLVSDEELSVVPTEINQCVYTKVVKVGGNIEGSLPDGSAVEFLNGVVLLSDQDTLNRSSVGDIVRLCLGGDSCPGNYKYKGTVYDMNNYTSGFIWTVSTSHERCDQS